ncbi:hypothetical protein AKO1_012282, partial [Acrasis kona]
MFSSIAGAYLSYASLKNNRLHPPYVLSRISCEGGSVPSLLLYGHEDSDKLINTINVKDLVIDCEPLFKVFTPFQALFWRTHFGDKYQTGLKNELRFMQVPHDQQSTIISSSNKLNAVRTIYVIRDEQDVIKDLRNELKNIKQAEKR